MSDSQLLRTTPAPGTASLLLAFAALPALLLTSSCSSEAPAGGASPNAAAQHDADGASHAIAGHGESMEEVHADGDHDAGVGHADDGHDDPNHADSEPATTEAAAASHDGHEHGPDDGHDHPQTAKLGVDEVLKPAEVDHDNGPRLTYPLGGEKHEFGRLMEGTVAEHTFELSNTGKEELIIKQVKPTCGCTVAQVFTETDSGEMELYTFGEAIAPGRKIHFPAKLHTKNKAGHQNTRINIFSNDPRGTIQLGLVADVDPFFNIAPRFLNFGQVSVGDVVEKKATISSSKGQPLTLSLVDDTAPAGATIDLVPVNPDAEGRAARWDLVVKLGEDLVEGNLARSIMIKSDEPIPGADLDITGKPSTYQATVTLSAQVVGPFSYTPPYLSMGLVRPGQVQVRTVQVECHDPEFSFETNPPKVSVVGLQNPGTETFRDWEYADRFTPTLRPVEGKNAVDIELRLEGMPDDATGSFRGTLLVELDHPSKKQIALVITGVCRGGPAK